MLTARDAHPTRYRAPTAGGANHRAHASEQHAQLRSDAPGEERVARGEPAFDRRIGRRSTVEMREDARDNVVDGAAADCLQVLRPAGWEVARAAVSAAAGSATSSVVGSAATTAAASAAGSAAGKVYLIAPPACIRTTATRRATLRGSQVLHPPQSARMEH